ncbi:MAG: DUF1194 domain-containing protein, partial [Rhodospirillaceae bacterium]
VMRRVRAIFIVLLVGLFLNPAARAELVDLELVLLVDVSGSIDDDEATLQREGYLKAITDPRVMQTIQSGRHGRIAVIYAEWAGDHYQQMLTDWHVIEDAASAKAFADRLAAQPLQVEFWTSISGAMRFGLELLGQSPHQGRRRVLDISGDGPNNSGGPVMAIRQQVLAQRVTINGLPIINGRPSRYGRLPMKNLDEYYRECVIGGTGAFMVVAHGFNDFARAIRRKLILEIAGAQPLTPRLVSAALPDPAICFTGERRRNWDFDRDEM